METDIDACLSRHAQQRIQQRGIDANAVQLLLTYGEEHRSRGASVFFLTASKRKALALELGKREADLLMQRLNLLVVEGNDGTVITVAHRTRRIRRDVARRAACFH